MDPTRITEALGIEPSLTQKVGENKITPIGTVLNTINRESFWKKELHAEKRISSTHQRLEDFVHEANVRLAPHSELFREITASGGYVEYFIGWFGGFNIGASLSPELMRETSALGIAIGLDVYAEEDETHNK